MKVINEELLSQFRNAPKCSWCGAANRGDIHPHHLLARGMGGGGRLDVRENLIALCAKCHHEVHVGHIQRCDLEAVIAAREGFLQSGELLKTLFAYMREPKPNVAVMRKGR